MWNGSGKERATHDRVGENVRRDGGDRSFLYIKLRKMRPRSEGTYLPFTEISKVGKERRMASLLRTAGALGCPSLEW
jgi:hypothetical protein